MLLRTLIGMAAAVLAALLMPAAPARADWYRAESPNFIVYGEMAQGRLRERVVLLEEFDAFLRQLTATTAPPSPNKLRVYLVHGALELQNVAPVGGGVGGFYTASPDGIVAVTDQYMNWRSMEDDALLHEYAHHFMMQYHPAPYPLWYVEGFADYVMTADISRERIEYGNYNPARATWLVGAADWVAYEEILFGDLKRVSAGAFYAQSWLLVHYIMADEGRRAAFVRYVRALARGEEARAAFAAAFGTAPPALDRTLRDYARRITFHRISRSGAAAAPPIAMTRIEGVGLDTPLVEAALLLGVPEAGRARLLDRARRVGRGDDAFGKRVQARAEILYGDLEAADRLLDPLLAAAPRDADLLYLKGLRHLVAGRRDRAARAAQYRLAKGYFARAFRADPNHYPALFRYAESVSEGDQFLTENIGNVLLLATSLAPQVIEIRLAAAHHLLLRDMFEQAQAILLPASATLHRSEGASRVEEFLRLARARQRPTDTVVFKTPESPPPPPARAGSR